MIVITFSSSAQMCMMSQSVMGTAAVVFNDKQINEGAMKKIKKPYGSSSPKSGLINHTSFFCPLKTGATVPLKVNYSCSVFSHSAPA
jgi:hypothetical protein